MERAKEYASRLYELITDGDGDVDTMFEMMVEDGCIDEDSHEWIYDDE